ncbi:hypothetical protein Tco_1142975 [Tanacetum coccineum]
MKDNPQLQHDLPIWLVLKIKFEGLHAFNTPCRSFAIHPRDQDDPHDDAHLKGENSNQEQLDDFDFWTDTYATDDDELPAKKVSQELVEEMSEIVNEAKLRKVVDEIRENGSVVSITEPDYKNLNNNDIEDMYSLCINGMVDDFVETGLLWSLSVFIKSTVIWERVHDFQLGVESYQQKVNLTTPTITFPGIEKHKMFFIVSEPVYVLEGLTSYNNDVKHGYVTPSLCKEDVEYLQLFEEEIERLKHRDQMRR